jgi:putative DNA primase/helicase
MWQLEWDPQKQRWNKVPYCAQKISKHASSTDPNSWATFDQARACYEEAPTKGFGWSGIGFVLGDGWVGVDIDGGLGLDGSLAAWAAAAIADLSIYKEYSVTGSGIHCIGRGSLPPGPREWKPPGCTAAHTGVALYSDGRYFACTGRPFNGAGAVNVPADWGQLHAKLFGSANGKHSPSPNGHTNYDLAGYDRNIRDTDLLNKARKAANGRKFSRLFDDGDWMNTYPSQSEADLALCSMLAFWAGPNPQRIDELFRQSALNREKWDRSDYVQRTVERALQTQTEFWMPGTEQKQRQQQPSPASNGPSEPKPFCWIGGTELAAMKAEAPKMVVEKMLPAASLTLDCAKPKSGKSTLTAELCHAVCLGRKALGKYAVTEGAALYWLPDDRNVGRFKREWDRLTGGRAVENFHLCVDHQELYPGGIENLKRAVHEFNPVLICIDSYMNIRSPHGKNTDFTKAEYLDMRLLSEFAGEYGPAVKLISHAGKAKRDDPMDSSVHSYGAGAGADVRMVLEKLEGTLRAVHIDGRDLNEFEMLYCRSTQRKLIAIAEGSWIREWKRIYRLASKPEFQVPFETAEAAEIFGITPRQMRSILNGWEELSILSWQPKKGLSSFSADVLRAVQDLTEALGA